MNKRFFRLLTIVVAGETIFMLPFMIPRLCRPLMLEAWGLTNTDIGTAFSAYGITAMLSYIFGGPFADKFPPRHLIAISLVLTALGSFYLVLFPSPINLIVTYAFYGVSTILLMWGALIKTTHIVGGQEQRSSALGILDGGRGLTAALATTVLVMIISLAYPHIEELPEQLHALRTVYITTALFTLFVAAAIWVTLKDFQENAAENNLWSFRRAVENLKNTQIWLLSAVILSAYCGYKSIDNYSIYMVYGHGLSLAHASTFTSLIFWLRPFAAVFTGMFADRYHRKNKSGRFVILFILLLLSGLSQLLLAFTGHSNFFYTFLVVLTSATFAYGLRALYFSVFGDLKIPTSLLGTTVGITSFAGFMPDIFFGLVTGYIIDSYPGTLGFEYSFMFTAACLFAGAIASFLLYRMTSKE